MHISNVELKSKLTNKYIYSLHVLTCVVYFKTYE